MIPWPSCSLTVELSGVLPTAGVCSNHLRYPLNPPTPPNTGVWSVTLRARKVPESMDRVERTKCFRSQQLTLPSGIMEITGQVIKKYMLKPVYWDTTRQLPGTPKRSITSVLHKDYSRRIQLQSLRAAIQMSAGQLIHSPLAKKTGYSSRGTSLTVCVDPPL